MDPKQYVQLAKEIRKECDKLSAWREKEHQKEIARIHAEYGKQLIQRNEVIIKLTQQKIDNGSSSHQTHESEKTEGKPRKLKYGQGSISKRNRKNKNGSTYNWYQIRWFDARGKLYTKTASSLEDANKTLARLKRDYQPNNLKTFGEHIHEWYDVYGRPNCGEKRNKSNTHQINCIPKKIMDKPLAQINAMEIQQYINTIKHPTPKVQTKQLIKATLVYAFNNALIKKNIGELLIANAPRAAEKQILPKELEKKFINLLPEKYRGYAIGLLYTGCRIGEFMRLNENWQTDIDYKNKKIKIRETKSLRQNDIRCGTTHVFREMPLLDPVAALKLPLPKIKQKTINPIFNIASKKLGISITPHCLRHTFISLCNELEINRLVIQEWVGHKTERMTMHYTHNTKELMEREFEKIRNGFVRPQAN